jgi:cold shock CspA family protein
MAKGTLIRLVRSHGHIFILMDDGYELFFMRHELRGTAYESLREGQRVEFEASWAASGARVVNVRLTGKPG